MYFDPRHLLRAEPFPPLTLGLLPLRGADPSKHRPWHPELCGIKCTGV